MLQLLSLPILALCAASVNADVGGATGTAVGFASGVTGGEGGATSTPTSAADLTSMLTDTTPRVIMITQEISFIGTEGTCTDCAGCIPESNTCGSAGQNAINSGSTDWCGSYPATKVTYDKAGISGIVLGSDKSIIGVGDSAVIRGKGFKIANGAKNIIIQNIFFTEINPEFIWGGDAISLDGTDNIWIDHCKFSLVGRQMIVTGYEASGSVTISYNEFDGQTSWSSSCDGHHYWAILGLGKGDKVTLYGNYIHHTSGRSPKLEYTSTWHAVNNYWSNNSGHAFDVATGSDVLIEGNVFEDVTTPLLADSTPGKVFVPTDSTASDCSTDLGRVCQVNVLTGSGDLAGTDSDLLADFQGSTPVEAHQASSVESWVLQNAGVGKI